MSPNYLYSCQLLAHKNEPWNRNICLHFVDCEGVQRSYVLADHDPFILLRFTNEDISDINTAEEYIQQILKPHNVELYDKPNKSGSYTKNGLANEISQIRQTPVVGFSNSRKDILFKIHLKRICDRGKLTKLLDNHNEHSDEPVIVLHRRVNDIMSLFHETGWKLHSWYNLSIPPSALCTEHNDTGSLYRDNIEILPDYSAPVFLPILFVRISAHSSTATRTNIFRPDHTIEDDCVNVIHATIRHMNKDQHHIKHTFLLDKIPQRDDNNDVSTYDTEMNMFKSFTQWLFKHRPGIVVHMSDPYDHLSYLHFRMKRYNMMESTLSMFPDYICCENQHMQTGEFRDLTCPGRECVDILHVLQKFMITPNLDGYTIEDAVAHPSLIRRETSNDPYTSKLLDMIKSYQNIDTTFQSIRDKSHHVFLECHILMRLETDNSFVVNNIALSKSCDLSLGHIISRGQQTRVFSCFMREYSKQGLYLNHDVLEDNYVTIKMERKNSSFPDHPWLQNPPIESLTTSTKPTQQTTLTDNNKNKTPNTNMNALQYLMNNVKQQQTKTKQKTKKKRYGGGFVIDPVPGFYHKARHSVVTLDFASLYPSIMCGYKICYMRVCYDKKWLHDPRAKKEYIPLDDHTCCVMISHYDGKPVQSITDILVWDVMKNRKKIRAQMKMVKDDFVRKSLDAQQLCCKVLQNAFYGACGSDTFAIPCTAIAASVCVIGQWMNKTVRYTALQEGCICVYGDTDSVMVQFPTDGSLTNDNDILESIYKQAKALEKKTTACFPKPNAVEFETMKRPFLMTDKKKTYAAYEYPPTDKGYTSTPAILIKGFAIKKRDRCTFVQKLGLELVFRLLSFQHTENELKSWFLNSTHKAYTSRPLTEQELQPFVISCRLNDVYKQENVIGPWLASKYEEESGTRPLPGKRLKYVIAMFYDGRKHYQSAVTPTAFLQNQMTLNTEYYLNKQLMLSIKQVLNRHVALYTSIQTQITKTIQLEKNKQQGIKSVLSFLSVNKKRKHNTF